MKILMLGWELPPHNSGGLGVACYQLCQSLAAKGVDIEFILPYDADHDINFMNITAAHPQGVVEILKSGIAYDSYRYLKLDGSEEWVDIYEQQLAYEKSVEKLIDSMEFDVIHAHDWLTFRAAMRVKAKTGQPMILHVHSLEHYRSGGKSGNPLVREIEYMAMTMADKVVAVSNHTKQTIMNEYSIPANRISVIHNSLDTAEIVPVDDSNAFEYLAKMKKQGYKVVANVGRLTIQKGLTNLMHAAKEVIDREPRTLFLIVGNGEQNFELIELAASLGISKNVLFTGFLRGKQWRDAFAIADLFVMPSISEPFGLTPLEAAGYGTPSLITKQSGVTEVFYNCLKVDFWDLRKMTDDIVAVIRNNSLRDELSRGAFNEYLELSWDNAAKDFIDHYAYLSQSGVTA